MSEYTDFTESWAPDQWRTECVRQARLAAGATAENERLKRDLEAATTRAQALERENERLREQLREAGKAPGMREKP
jgi:hypothetical protein